MFLPTTTLRGLRLVLSALLLLWGCVAPAVGPGGGRATLRVVLEAPTTYRLAYLASPDWRRATAMLTAPGGAPMTADAARGGSLTFASVPPGAGYSLTIRLYRPSPEGPEVEVGRLERASLTLVAGPNTLSLADLNPAHPRPTVAAGRALGDVYVSSLPAEGITGAAFRWPGDVAADASGTVYVADTQNHRIRKVAPDGTVSTLAGSGVTGWMGGGHQDGPGATALFKDPLSLAVDASGTVYVADAGNNRIRKVAPDGTVSTLAGSGTAGHQNGAGASARFNYPKGVAVDASGTVYVADASNNRVRKVAPDGTVSTLAGSGTAGLQNGAGASARFNGPGGVAVDASGTVYVADTYNASIRRVASDGTVSTLAGTNTRGYVDGPAASARFHTPGNLDIDASGTLYVADGGNQCIRVITSGGTVSTLAGLGTADPTVQLSYNPGDRDGVGGEARFHYPGGVAVDAGGHVFVADTRNNRIRKIAPDRTVTTLAGSGLLGLEEGPRGPGALVTDLQSLAVDAWGSVHVLAGNRLWRLSSAGIPTFLAGGPWSDYRNGFGEAARFNTQNGLALDAQGNMYLADENGHRIRKVTPEGEVTTIAGPVATAGPFSNTVCPNCPWGYFDGPAADARFYFPSGLAVDASGTVYVADSGNCLIRRLTPEGQVSTFAGSPDCGLQDGVGTAALFSWPNDVAVDASGTLYVADAGNAAIRKVTPEGVVTTLAGDGNEGYQDGVGSVAQFGWIEALAVTPTGWVYVADRDNNCIREVAPDGTVTTLAGALEAGRRDGPGPAARFDTPWDVAVGADGVVYVADQVNSVVRIIKRGGR
ncbi:MAG: hypothetical protein VKS61_11815 [Candidatus Sericytochromatia bacterium]|nr:hypothetical protein [Candidatus Sericytochromatia bacterium]